MLRKLTVSIFVLSYIVVIGKIKIKFYRALVPITFFTAIVLFSFAINQLDYVIIPIILMVYSLILGIEHHNANCVGIEEMSNMQKVIYIEHTKNDVDYFKPTSYINSSPIWFFILLISIIISIISSIVLIIK